MEGGRGQVAGRKSRDGILLRLGTRRGGRIKACRMPPEGPGLLQLDEERGTDVLTVAQRPGTALCTQ